MDRLGGGQDGSRSSAQSNVADFGAKSTLTSSSTIIRSRSAHEDIMHSGHPDGDAAIRQTDSDAALARWSAVQRQYFTDPFIKPLLPRGAQHQPPRAPLINVGTYVRSEGIDRLVEEWFQLSAQEGKQCQIVSLGAGSDTRFWRIAVRARFVLSKEKGAGGAERSLVSGRLALTLNDWRHTSRSISPRILCTKRLRSIGAETSVPCSESPRT